MSLNFREFEAKDPFGRAWQVRFVWQQNGISIRHSDTVDVKFQLSAEGDREEKVVALPHPGLLALAERMSRTLNDAWCSKLAAQHMKRMIETGDDLEKALVTVSAADLEAASTALESSRA